MNKKTKIVKPNADYPSMLWLGGQGQEGGDLKYMPRGNGIVEPVEPTLYVY